MTEDGHTTAAEPGEQVDFTIIFNKERLRVKFPSSSTIGSLKEHIQTLTGLPSAMQKLVYKGISISIS